MLNQRVISVEVKGNEFVKKIQIVLKDLPTPFPSFKKVSAFSGVTVDCVSNVCAFMIFYILIFIKFNNHLIS